MAQEGSDELYLPGSSSWEFPLTRSEKLQRLLLLFEGEADNFASEVEVLRRENASLRAQLGAGAAARQQAPRDGSGAEVDLGEVLPGSSGVIRGSPELVAEAVAALRGCRAASSLGAAAAAQGSGASSPASTQESSPSESLLPTPPETPEDRWLRALGPESQAAPCAPGPGARPKLPGLGLDRLGSQAAATPRSSRAPAFEAATGSTPRCFSIRTPPASTPRVLSLVTPRSRQGLLELTPSSLSAAHAATPRSLSRVCSLVTPRTGFGTPSAALTGPRSARQAPALQQLYEESVASRRRGESGATEDSGERRVSSDSGSKESRESSGGNDKLQSASSPRANPVTAQTLDDDDEDSDSEDGSSASAEPEWMSFATPDGGGPLLADLERFWSSERPQGGGGGATEQPHANTIEITSEALWGLVADRAQQEIARALEEATQSHPAWRQARRPPPRRPRRGERSDLVVTLARQGAAAASSTARDKSELLKPVAQRLGKSVARAGTAMQDAGRLARGASAVVSSRTHGHTGCQAGLSPEVRGECHEASAKASKEASAMAHEASAKVTEAGAKANKVVHAASAVTSKLLHKMPKGLADRVRRRPKAEVQGD